MRHGTYQRVESQSQFSEFVSYPRLLKFLECLPPEHVHRSLHLRSESRSQILQDLFVLSQTNFKECGYFVEFGAADGTRLSNTYLLEKKFHWEGIAAEPARVWHDALRRNRNCHIEVSCVWSSTGQALPFAESALHELSTVAGRSDAKPRGFRRAYDVPSISLLDLLAKYDAPRNIDYLSIDTEGSEYEILKAFDFAEYRIGIVTCEHNYQPHREQIWKLMLGAGYRRVLAELSEFEDWYVLDQA